MKKKISKKREIEFDIDTLLERLEGVAAGTQSVKERVIKIPPPVKPISSKEIRTIRLNMGYTQIQFASLLNVPKVTAISWENGQRKPSGAALRLLAITRKYPEVLEAAV